ncbi:Trp biosynthesis-associated membrane protein [Kineococcus esterisolvens]|uniref:Trp biosynthesis-associated membrane protein n=1 Tax=unclassified Kineococcus TaxID=2621656 RepID=UPI003D7CF27B
MSAHPNGTGVPAARRRGRERALVLTVAAAGAVLALAAGAPTWVRGAVSTAAGLREVAAAGRAAAPTATALALVALAAVVACSLGRRAARALAALVLVLAGAGVAAAGVDVWTSPEGALAAPARLVSGRSDPQVQQVRTRPWPLVCAAGGAVCAAAGAAAVLRGRSWSTSARHERDAAAAEPASRTPAGASPAEPAAAWDSLSRGDDPTR